MAGVALGRTGGALKAQGRFHSRRLADPVISLRNEILDPTAPQGPWAIMEAGIMGEGTEQEGGHRGLFDGMGCRHCPPWDRGPEPPSRQACPDQNAGGASPRQGSPCQPRGTASPAPLGHRGSWSLPDNGLGGPQTATGTGRGGPAARGPREEQTPLSPEARPQLQQRPSPVCL